jgi:hypothetical protein
MILWFIIKESKYLFVCVCVCVCIITFTNDNSRYGYVYLMKHKSKLFEWFKEFRIQVKKQTKKSANILWFDQSGEYLSKKFQDYNEIL